MFLYVCALFSLIGLPPQAPAEQKGIDTDLQISVNMAIDRGVEALLAQQEIDGSWRSALPGFPAGMTSLALYTLIKSGLTPNHPAIRNGREFVRRHPPEKTYSLACAILAETSYKEHADQENLQRMVDRMVKWQKNDGYGYPGGTIDLSNTQYAALALHVAAENGAKVPNKVWRRFGSAGLKYAVELESGPAVTGSVTPVGFQYRTSSGAVTGSMTAAGVTVLQIASMHSKGKDAEVIAVRDQGVAWLGKHFLVKANPCPEKGAEGIAGRHFYYLYGLERTAGLIGLTELGGHRWYEEGAEFLVNKQSGDGRWRNNQSQTCFALLFLSRATVGGIAATGSDVDGGSNRDQYSYGRDDSSRPISLRGSGRDKITLWVSSVGDKLIDTQTWPGEAGPRVAAVRYRMERKSAVRPLTQVIEIPIKDPGKPMAGRRFAWSGTLDAPGTWEVMVEMDIVPLGGVIEDSGTWMTVRSIEANIPFQGCWIPRMENYASGPRNLIANMEITSTASSEHHANWAATRACDQFQGTGWLSADDDPLPTIILELDAAIRANTMVLSHAYNLPSPDTQRSARVKLLRYRFNGSNRWTEATMVENDWHKTVIDLGKTLKVKSLTIEVLEVHPGQESLAAVGFNEIELQRLQ
jgi:hypothetical protein